MCLIHSDRKQSFAYVFPGGFRRQGCNAVPIWVKHECTLTGTVCFLLTYSAMINNAVVKQFHKIIKLMSNFPSLYSFILSRIVGQHNLHID